MSPRFARVLAVLYFAGYIVAVTWPGMTYFNRVEPLIFGLPFNMVWVAIWVIGGAGVLWMVYTTEPDPDRVRPDAPASSPRDGG